MNGLILIVYECPLRTEDESPANPRGLTVEVSCHDDDSDSCHDNDSDSVTIEQGKIPVWGQNPFLRQKWFTTTLLQDETVYDDESFRMFHIKVTLNTPTVPKPTFLDGW